MATSVEQNAKRRVMIPQNFILIWLRSTTDDCDTDFKYVMTKLREIINTIYTFTDPDQCIDFLSDTKEEIVFMIVSDFLIEKLVHLIHDVPQLYSVYVCCQNKTEYEECAKEWSKVKRVFTEIESACEMLKRDIQQYDRDSISISMTSTDLNHLDPSFMYTQLLKEALLGIEYGDNARVEFIVFLRDLYCENEQQMNFINEFEQDYHLHTPIWWYTRESFLYQMLNRALRTQQIDIILKMGFFLHDIHRQIEDLYSQTEHKEIITVYRGQGISNADFEKIKQNQGGLFAFNNFLSTSVDRQLPLFLAESSGQNPLLTGILFTIAVDPTVKSALFAVLKNVSYFSETEQEVLFGMHTVFRINKVEMIEDRLWEVKLTLTRDDDEELKILTNYIRQEIRGPTEWHRLGQMLFQTGNFDDAEKIFKILLENTPKENEAELSNIFHHLGAAKHKQTNYVEAQEFYQRTLQTHQKSLPLDHLSLATTYCNIGLLYVNMGEYANALEFYQKTLEIRQKFLPSNHPELGITYGNVGQVYEKTAEYSKALQCYQKALEIWQKTLPSIHPNLALIHNNIGRVFMNLGEYSQSLESYRKTLQIAQKSLSSTHPDLAFPYSNIGLVYFSMGQYTKALENHQQTLEIRQKSLPPDHPDLAITYDNLAQVYDKMGQYPEALKFYHKSLEIEEKCLPRNHPDLATTCNNLGQVYYNTGQYPKAIELYQKSLEIQRNSLPKNHPDLAATYNNIASVYYQVEEHSKALKLYQKTLKICKLSLPPNHPDLATTYNNIASILYQMEKYPKALEIYQKTLEIRQISLPSDHSDLAITYQNIGSVHEKMKNHSKALVFYQKTLDILRRSLPQDHPYLATIYSNIGSTYKNTGEYSKALEFYEKAREIEEHSLPPNHPNLAITYNYIGQMHNVMGSILTALSFHERAVTIGQQSLPENHRYLQVYRKNLAVVQQKYNALEKKSS